MAGYCCHFILTVLICLWSLYPLMTEIPGTQVCPLSAEEMFSPLWFKKGIAISWHICETTEMRLRGYKRVNLLIMVIAGPLLKKQTSPTKPVLNCWCLKMADGLLSATMRMMADTVLAYTCQMMKDKPGNGKARLKTIRKEMAVFHILA